MYQQPSLIEQQLFQFQNQQPHLSFDIQQSIAVIEWANHEWWTLSSSFLVEENQLINDLVMMVLSVFNKKRW